MQKGGEKKHLEMTSQWWMWFKSDVELLPQLE